MEKLQVGQVVYLENNTKYGVISVIENKGNRYVYLMTIEEPYRIKFAREIVNGDRLDLKIINDKQEKEELLPLFQADMINNNL